MNDDILNKYFDLSSGSYKKNDNGTYDVIGDVYVHKTNSLKIHFGKVQGNFKAAECGLTSLIGSPTEVTGFFYCYGNQLSSLLGGPKKVGKSFLCHDNPLTSLKGAPDSIGENYGITLSWSENLPLLSLLKYDFIECFGNIDVENILRKYEGNRRSAAQTSLRTAIIQCQRELIDAGFAGNANL